MPLWKCLHDFHKRAEGSSPIIPSLGFTATYFKCSLYLSTIVDQFFPFSPLSSFSQSSNSLDAPKSGYLTLWIVGSTSPFYLCFLELTCWYLAHRISVSPAMIYYFLSRYLTLLTIMMQYKFILNNVNLFIIHFHFFSGYFSLSSLKIGCNLWGVHEEIKTVLFI